MSAFIAENWEAIAAVIAAIVGGGLGFVDKGFEV
jgi:hypothetical protein